jgi:hypothetical protein
VTPREYLHALNVAKDTLNQAERVFLLSMGWQDVDHADGTTRWRDTPSRTWIPQGLAVALAKTALADGVEPQQEEDSEA